MRFQATVRNGGRLLAVSSAFGHWRNARCLTPHYAVPGRIKLPRASSHVRRCASAGLLRRGPFGVAHSRLL
eukprot:5148727-Alexandrium_andersonii.AAC.1